MKCDNIKRLSKEETYWRDSSPNKIEPLSYCPGDLRDLWTFPHCSRPMSSRYSVLAGFPGYIRHFLLLVWNMGQFPELTLVHRQTTEVWLSTPGAGEIWWRNVNKKGIYRKIQRKMILEKTVERRNNLKGEDNKKVMPYLWKVGKIISTIKRSVN